jgi:GT2 family glycosyltransferase
MRKSRSPKESQQTAVNKITATAILNEASRDFPSELNSLLVAASGVILLTGWADDRSSKLLEVRLNGETWSKIIENRHIGRHRRADIGRGLVSTQHRFFGFWAVTAHDRTLINGKTCLVELILANGSSKAHEVPIEFIAADDLRTRFAKFWGDLADEDRRPPLELTYVEQALQRPIGTVVMPKHNIESVVVAEDGGVFVNGWVDDSTASLGAVCVTENDGHATFEDAALARTYRDDVQTALAISRKHEFGFWGFAANQVILPHGNTTKVNVIMRNGARQDHEVAVRRVDETELRNTVLTYLASANHLGNWQFKALTDLENYIGDQILQINLRISRKIVSQPYVERFGRRSAKYKGSIVVCLYGKPEYLSLQGSLFSNRPGIENYEFIYICNSPELAESLLRDAHISSFAYGLDTTIVILPGNAGFGAANNAAADFAQSDRILIVNPDVFPFDQDWAAKHIDIVEQLPPEQTRIFGVPLYYDDGSLMHGGMYFEADRGVFNDGPALKTMTSLRVEHYGKGAPPLTSKFIRSRPVPAVTGAFISLDRTWFDEAGRFSEDYVFGHYEDADLCLKSLEKGICPWIHDIKLWHLEGHGSHRLPVHEGASIVNRWLFNRRWAAKVIPDLVGQVPKLPLPGRTATPNLLSFSRERRRDANLVNERKERRRSKASKRGSAYDLGEEIHSGLGGIELVFGGN